jgi:hypothetical protein
MSIKKGRPTGQAPVPRKAMLTLAAMMALAVVVLTAAGCGPRCPSGAIYDESLEECVGEDHAECCDCLVEFDEAVWLGCVEAPSVDRCIENWESGASNRISEACLTESRCAAACPWLVDGGSE